MPMKAALYARVSTHDQQTLPLQLKAMRAYAKKRVWVVGRQIKEIGSGTKTRPQREEMVKAVRRREVDVIIVWRLDRWGRSLADLVTKLKELSDLGIGFLSLTEAIDLTTPSGRALGGMLAVFAEFERDILRERVKAGIAQAREKGEAHGRPTTAAKQAAEVKELFKKGLSKSEIAKRLRIGRTSVIRILNQKH
jgi:putative DNA-invertase from lambdoid prophage Rac